MDEFEQSDLEKETDDWHNIFNQNVKHYGAREKAFIKKSSVWYILSFS